MMNNKTFIYKFDDVDYVVNVEVHAFQKATYFRFHNNEFFVSTSKLVSQKTIMDGLDKYARRLIKANQKRIEKAYSFPERWMYLFGNKITMPDEINENNINTFLKSQLLSYLNDTVPYYEKEMGIKKPYKIRVRDMKSRYGSNSLKTHSVCFQLDLAHFSSGIIDSVIVHELAHEFYRDHSKEFYRLIVKYCPNYYELKKKLRKKIYQ